MPASAEIQTATLNRFIEGWKGWTPDGFLASWSHDCTQVTLPFSSGVPPHTRASVTKLFPQLMSILTNFQLIVHNVIHDPAQSKAVIYAITTADSPFGPYKNEQACFVWFDESGEYVTRIEEMFDGVFMQNFLPKLEAYIKGQGGS
ncbi:hypothetical protein McanCB56680_006474 [Microsporum canis]|uniref:SnoaL-like domain-containing protein n=1 Tax=Arthroderma otae (strain ATCC MYA-4605 / CBS 113480) TaxID=554155 RepID=C5FVF0_ARTOC|nr:conserved hypothetical protein [Microsporum canis CBS 113480]EEQ33884.1 conserved hypothetical protein [Microsporum canis CBS 113480]